MLVKREARAAISAHQNVNRGYRDGVIYRGFYPFRKDMRLGYATANAQAAMV